ncbi:hypothetical protein Tco_0221452 [Tanacetum coccineum]
MRVAPERRENSNRSNVQVILLQGSVSEVRRGPLVQISGSKPEKLGKKQRKKFNLRKNIVGYQWRPTGKKFALGELCPLTRLLVTCTTMWYRFPLGVWNSAVPKIELRDYGWLLHLLHGYFTVISQVHPLVFPKVLQLDQLSKTPQLLKLTFSSQFLLVAREKPSSVQSTSRGCSLTKPTKLLNHRSCQKMRREDGPKKRTPS